MTAIWDWIIGPIAGPVLGAALLFSLASFGITWTVQHWEAGRLTSELAEAKDSVTNPQTGWAARLDRAETNFDTVEKALDAAKASIDALASDSAKRDGENKSAMSGVAAAARGAKAAADKLLAMPSTTAPGTLASCLAGEAFIRGATP